MTDSAVPRSPATHWSTPRAVPRTPTRSTSGARTERAVFLRGDRWLAALAALAALGGPVGHVLQLGLQLVGGALLAYLVARRLRVSLPTERRAHEPGQMFSARDELQARVAGRRVALVGDVIDAGSAVRSSLAAITGGGGTPVAVAALLRLGDTALDADPADHTRASTPTVAAVPLHVLSTRNNELWEPRLCPPCAQALPLQSRLAHCGT